jgi:RHH-type transcriptional regulator, proline utilization regulon repressor / proline dehydrogenase / delta 1-pyrroline-5-carboxylate dehydrogenase
MNADFGSQQLGSQQTLVDEVTDNATQDDAVQFAISVLQASKPTRDEARKAKRLDSILASSSSRDALMRLTDEVLRVDSPTHSMALLGSAAQKSSLGGFPGLDRMLLQLGVVAGRISPSLTKRIVDARIKVETKGVIVAKEEPQFTKSISEMGVGGFRTNVNVLGESILGDDQADARLADVLGVLNRKDTGYVSVKISALCANLDVLAFDHSIERICERLRVLYRAALKRQPVGFVNLDMEEYRDLRLTMVAFMKVLDETEFRSLSAGIVLQAYLPDSNAALAELSTWAIARRDAGGAPIKIRLVKGANLAMEMVEAESHGWVSAPYATKNEVDANLKRLLELALDPSLDGAINIGLGSHNLFDIGWARSTAARLRQAHRLEFEMLAGMAPAQSRVVSQRTGGVRVYAPTVEESAMDAAISYLARRLDENAGEENFLRNLLQLEPGTTIFAAEEKRFRSAASDRLVTEVEPRRHRPSISDSTSQVFRNASDSDFTDPQRREAATHALNGYTPRVLPVIETTAQIDALLDNSRSAHNWATPADRLTLLNAVAQLMEQERFESLAVMAHETGKTIREGDPEVSEAIDAVRYATTVGAKSINDLRTDGIDVEPIGTVVVTAPWNFPYAIPTLTIASALVSGNSVVLKPAPEAIAVGAHLVDQFHRAGIPKHALQLVICEDGPVGTHLVSHDATDLVVLTGSSQTAQAFVANDPGMRLVAETSGKNAMIITDAADIDAAIGYLVKSAFGHAGQKCSAASLVILVGSVGTDPAVRECLADAVRSLRTGDAKDLATIVGPVIGAPSGNLLRALTVLEPGESWLVNPVPLDGDNGVSWTPGVKLGVKPGSWFHRTECFGPVLGVMTADTLDEAIRIQNDSDFGLTGGLCSLDPAEITQWTRHVEVGNAYVNRQMTGAIVGRQPFGGWKGSSVGGGSKPGGPDHVLGFVKMSRSGQFPAESEITKSYAYWMNNLYGVDTDVSGLVSEHNVLRHHSLSGVVVLAGPEVPTRHVDALRTAAKLANTPLYFADSEAAGVAAIEQLRPERVRVLSSQFDTKALQSVAHQLGAAIDRTPSLGHGRVELGRWLKEQAISVTNHRHGRLLTNMAEALRTSRPR